MNRKTEKFFSGKIFYGRWREPQDALITFRKGQSVKTKYLNGERKQSIINILPMIGPSKNVYIDFWLCMQSCLICEAFFPMGEICFNEYLSPFFSHTKTSGRGWNKEPSTNQ